MKPGKTRGSKEEKRIAKSPDTELSAKLRKDNELTMIIRGLFNGCK
jgi:hypothetical protein